ncbi:hypothetical protein CYMTET_51390 [Cymbomonas tetramitiformis]|uniref:Uncharacterized protein n=1 Tax=Cymbomonas tetramitiformis TaxID=36881 RepID=A0AAE0ESD8_9CHLO|nr:hypothetical protein CYMTET_51390 [Cymbomonas tetramitiformis]
MNRDTVLKKNVTHLEISTGETNPDQDIKSAPGTKDKQLRTEGDATYSNHPPLRKQEIWGQPVIFSNLGTLSTAKTRELYDRYAQAVGDVAAQRPTEKQLAKRLKLKLGAYQFNPAEYTTDDLYRALKKAINATKTAEPVLGRDPDTTEEDIIGDRWLQREPGKTEENEPQPESQWDNNGKGYPEPDRRFNRSDMVYTEGSQRKIKREDGEQEEATAAGKDNVMQRMKRKLETGPEEWDIKKQRIARTEAKHARKNEETNEPEEGEDAVGDTWPEEMEAQQMQEDEIEFQQMEQEEEAALMLAQNMQTLQQEEGGHATQPMVGDIGEGGEEPVPEAQENEWEVEEGELRRMQEEEMSLTHEGRQEQRETQSQQEPDHARPATRTVSQEIAEAQEGQQDIALQVTQEMELPETQDMRMEEQQEAEDDLIEMAQQQEEVQEEQSALQEMAQQQAAAQREAQLEQRWRRASMEKIRIAAKETPEKYMQHLRGDTAMHKLSNEYWEKEPNT